MFSHCTDSHQTLCVKCNRGEYQPNWNGELRCRQQKLCDPVKGFMERPENPVAEEPCRCVAGFQCSEINCEYCERIPTCGGGDGLELDPESTYGRKECFPCKAGYFSTDNNGEECKQWTNCKAEGRREIQPGSAEADAVCGPHVSGTAPSGVIVSVLSVITVLCLLILLLFCYKDKLKLLSVNLRSCVQNLKRTRIQQETLAPLYPSGAGGGIGGLGGSKGAPCETTNLIYPATQCATTTDETLCTFPTTSPDVKVSIPATETSEEEEEVPREPAVTENQSEGSGEPEEVSEDEDAVVAPLLAGSCACVMPVRQPLEVGENEDCSQAVTPGSSGSCSCGGLDGDEGGGSEKSESLKVERGLSLLSHGPQLPELCLPLSQAQARPELKPRPSAASTDSSPPKEDDAASDGTSVTRPLVVSPSVSGLQLDKTPEASNQGQGPNGLSWGDGRAGQLSSAETALDCTPESLHSQLAEPTLTSGQVSGNHNTTFISSGQVMNFSGDVIVVYVGQTSLGGDGAEQDATFGSPVQEEANEMAPFFRSCPGSSQNETLPIQEVMVE